MRIALELAEEAQKVGDVPVGAVVVKDDLIVGRGFNQREWKQNPLLHAEVVAIQDACARLGSWRLSGCQLYVTLEPCLMCAGAIYQARLDQVIFGATDPKAGATGSLYQIHQDHRLNHRFQVVPDVLSEPSAKLLKDFFKSRR